MSLQYYDINIGLTGTQKVGAQGKYIYYYQGTTPNIVAGTVLATAGNQAIKVQAGQSGNTILLMPGQSYRLDEADKSPTEWLISNLKGLEVITGQVLIGEGEFIDSNTTNVMKLDATFANNVKVTNDTLSRIPVTLDTNQILQIAGQTVQYTNSFIDASPAANVAIQVFTAAQNPNGAYIEFAEIALSASNFNSYNVVTLLAKATAPTSPTDGDGIMVAVCNGGNGASAYPNNVNQILGQRIKIPAGKGLWINQQVGTGAGDRCIKTILFTLL